jgi:plastocyanin
MRLRHVMTVGAIMGALACGSSSGPTGGGNGGNPPPPPPSGINVSVKEYSFSPDSVTIKVGTTVQWVNVGGLDHHVVSDDNVWDSGNLAPPSGDGGYYGGGSTSGTSYRYTFTQAGTYRYHCANHPTTVPAYANFKGVIVVTP